MKPLTFNVDNELVDYLLRYICALCENQGVLFWCQVTYDKSETENEKVFIYAIRKSGQSPPWSIEMPAPVARALPVRSAEFYRRGLICVSQNFGLAAVGYFRRVVEQVSDHLLDLVEETAKEHGDHVTVDRIAEARRSHQATDRLKFAAEQLPLYLRPGGKNPLSDMYASYSEGIHSLSDEECLEVALDVRAALDYLLPSLHDQLATARAYQISIAKAKRRQKPTGPAGR